MDYRFPHDPGDDRGSVLKQMLDHSTPSEDAQVYEDGSALLRARGRIAALTLTFLIELLPAFMILSGGGALEKALGRDKAVLFTGFITLVSAVSGNVGLQSSSLTTRAISHGLAGRRTWVRTILRETLTAAYLSTAMGFLTALVAYQVSSDGRVGVCVGVAQFTSMLMAGVTGTLAPLLFKLALGRDPGCWAGPLETAVQDIIGTYSLFFISVKILQVFYSPA